MNKVINTEKSMRTWIVLILKYIKYQPATNATRAASFHSINLSKALKFPCLMIDTKAFKLTLWKINWVKIFYSLARNSNFLYILPASNNK